MNVGWGDFEDLVWEGLRRWGENRGEDRQYRALTVWACMGTMRRMSIEDS